VEIGEYIDVRRIELETWGGHVVSTVKKAAAGLLKVPAECRVKDVTSARAKQVRKGYLNPAVEMTDLVGARFVVLTLDDLRPIQAVIEQNSSWSYHQSRDPLFEMAQDPTSFVYQSHHYEVRPNAAAQLGNVLVQPEICCEVQIRTLLQHAYAELTHDSLYKPDQAVPSQSERLVARSMALMETTDELLSRAILVLKDANRPALDLASVANELTGGFAFSDSDLLTRVISKEYSEIISLGAVDELRDFVEHHQFVLGRISERNGRGIFSFPAAALIGYWVAFRLENSAESRWPLPGSINEFRQMLADLGIGGPIH
jgi:putative GTP pyrophosphokinase